MNLFKKALIAVLGLGLVVAPSAANKVEEVQAADFTKGTELYLKPNSNWTQANARFATYFFNNSTEKNAWASMTDNDGDGIYEVVAPEGTWKNLIFCRMNPGTTANNWNNGTLWNQTSDLTYDGEKNMYTIASGAWDKGAGTWSTYVAPTFTLAGKGMYGAPEWSATDSTYTLEKQEDGSYSTIVRFAANSEFKVVTDGSWDNPNYGAEGGTDNFKVTEAGLYTVTFKNKVPTVTKFVSENHLAVKSQTNSETGAFRLIGTFGDLNHTSIFDVNAYIEVGFELTWNGSTKSEAAGYLYTSVTADGVAISAEAYDAQYFFCFTFNNVPAEGSFTARAYAKDVNGVTEYGALGTFTF